MEVFYAQIFILLAYVAMIFSVMRKEENHILFFQTILSFFFSIAFFLLGAYTGFLINILSMIRNYIYCKYEQENNLFLLLVFVVMGSVLTYNHYDGLLSLLPLIAFSSYSFLLWKNSYKLFIYGNMINSLMWLTYDGIVGAYLGVVGESVIVMISIHLIMTKFRKRSDNHI